ncbi:hypothetical protein [Leadbettera azotonutricia]|uniref:Uncharacterized protein n=1 Tax=Leadbettera azotonutricia (strain ATCC BAA-888 / DSM 13862 / ZAS-9) TaxID=545695 RepID=F5Y6Z9_LEAAZ|nr:hypothetical protein [Leadbettera azotonutricia]AEF81747.1 conserved hypothetical protein [Leadbettera azotonutricia ZAS-9]
MRKLILIALILGMASSVFAWDRYTDLGNRMDHNSTKYHSILDQANIDNDRVQNDAKRTEYERQYNDLLVQMQRKSTSLQAAVRNSEPSAEIVSKLRGELEDLLKQYDALVNEYTNWLESLKK